MLVGLVLMLMSVYEVQQADRNTDFDVWRARISYYFAGGFSLVIVSTAVYGVRKYKLIRSGRITGTSFLSDEDGDAAPSWEELQKMGGAEELFAWVSDCLGTIVLVFCFAFFACTICNTHPLLAAACLTCAILFRPMAQRSQRIRENLFGKPSSDVSAARHTGGDC